MTPLRIVRFGTFEFDCSTGELRNGGRRVPLQSQPAQVLAQLVSRPGDVVPREALRDEARSVVEVPAGLPGPYQVILTGIADGPFVVTVTGRVRGRALEPKFVSPVSLVPVARSLPAQRVWS